MADLENYKVQWKYVPRPWGMEIRLNAINLKTGVVFQEVIPFGKEKPDEKQIDVAIAARLDQCEAAILQRDAITEEPMQIVTKKQVEEYLKTEGILKGSDTLDTLRAVK